MASTDPRTEPAGSSNGPVLLAYDGTELAAHAIAEAGARLAASARTADEPERLEALVLCVWQPEDVGFIPTGTQHFDPASAAEVSSAAQATAAYGASLADQAGFRAQSLTIEAAPIWSGIILVAQEHHASLIVLGSRHRTGLAGHLLGNVAASVIARARTPVLLVPELASAVS